MAVKLLWWLTLAAVMAASSTGLVEPGGILYPRDSETRQSKSLDGLWNFRLSPTSNHRLGFDQYWYKKDLAESGKVIQMPVPASYNDITQDALVRDHVGLAWYDRKFFVSDLWGLEDTRVWLRFSSVHYAAQVVDRQYCGLGICILRHGFPGALETAIMVCCAIESSMITRMNIPNKLIYPVKWVNGELVMNHDVGHLPFQREITSLLIYGKENRVTVSCDNMLRLDTVPQGQINEMPTDDGKKLVQTYTFDFFNYAGIHRPVTLYTTPNIYIDDITVDTDVEGDTGIVTFHIEVGGADNETEVYCKVLLLDKAGNPVAKDNGTGDHTGTLIVPLARFWWPYLMDPDPGYLYTLEVTLSTQYEEKLDVYRLPVGIRKLTWTNDTFLINNRPLYLHGFGRHEDSDIRGKGLDLALTMRDYNLIRWVGANVYRTSHYPYAEEIMDLADKMGIMIIDECPSVDTDQYSGALLEKHKDSLTELIRRDKNRPAVIAWSIANEPRSQQPAADSYFGEVVKHVKSFDTSRPVTIALARAYFEDKTGQHLDIISFNRYNGWYSNPGQLDMITQRVIAEAEAWHNKYNKPVLMSEYGADTYEGLHLYPEYVWSEDYQVELMSRHFKAFDQLREKGWFIGEFIWNFADFKTAQTTTRVGGNKKGIFTRNRQPKASAHHLRGRYHQLAHQLYNSPLPHDLHPYEVQKNKSVFRRTEL